MSIHVETDQASATRQVVRIGDTTLHADMTGEPDGHDLFDASLAACKALTAHVYAKARGYALDRVVVDVERDATEERQGKYKLRVKIALFGALSDEEKKKVYGVLERCPVHKLMTTTDVVIETAPLEL